VTLKSLHDVKGNVVLTSTDGARCDQIPSSIVEGQYSCDAAGGSDPSHGLTAGAIAGIVIGSVAVLAAIVIGALWLRWRHRRRSVVEISAADRPPVPSKDHRSSYGYYDLKDAEQVLDAGRVPVNGDNIPMTDLDKKQMREDVQERGIEHELPTEANIAIHELPTSPEGAAHELPSPGDRRRSRIAEREDGDATEHDRTP
jgi:hypothetical protein